MKSLSKEDSQTSAREIGTAIADLRHTDLRGVDLATKSIDELNLDLAVLEETKFQGASLRDQTLLCCRFGKNTDLQGVDVGCALLLGTTVEDEFMVTQEWLRQQGAQNTHLAITSIDEFKKLMELSIWDINNDLTYSKRLSKVLVRTLDHFALHEKEFARKPGFAKIAPVLKLANTKLQKNARLRAITTIGSTHFLIVNSSLQVLACVHQSAYLLPRVVLSTFIYRKVPQLDALYAAIIKRSDIFLQEEVAFNGYCYVFSGNLSAIFDLFLQEKIIDEETRQKCGKIVGLDAQHAEHFKLLTDTMSTGQLAMYETVYGLYLDTISECIQSPILFARVISYLYGSMFQTHQADLAAELRSLVPADKQLDFFDCLASLNKLLYGRANFESTFEKSAIPKSLPTLSAQRRAIYDSCVALLNTKLAESACTLQERLFAHFVLNRYASLKVSIGFDVTKTPVGLTSESAEFDEVFRTKPTPENIVDRVRLFQKLCLAAQFNTAAIVTISHEILDPVLKGTIELDMASPSAETPKIDPTQQFRTAVESEDWCGMSVALRAGADVNAILEIHTKRLDFTGTAVAYLIQKNNKQLFLELLQHHPSCSDVETYQLAISKDLFGWNYLGILCEHSPEACVRVFLENNLLKYSLDTAFEENIDFYHENLLSITSFILDLGGGIEKDLSQTPEHMLRDCVLIGSKLPAGVDAITSAEQFIERMPNQKAMVWVPICEIALASPRISDETKAELSKILQHIQSFQPSSPKVTQLQGGFFRAPVGSTQIQYFQRFASDKFRKVQTTAQQANAVADCENLQEANSVAQGLQKFGIITKITQHTEYTRVTVENITSLNEQLKEMKSSHKK